MADATKFDVVGADMFVTPDEVPELIAALQQWQQNQGQAQYKLVLINAR